MPCSVYFTQQQLGGIQERMRDYPENTRIKDDKKPENRDNRGLDKIVSCEILDSW